MTRNHGMLALFVALCLGAGGIGGWVTAQSVTDWYPGLSKPGWNPPAAVFAPVWTALYVLMGIAAWLVWRRGAAFSGVRVALILFFVQLVLNLLWPFAFFGARSPFLGLVEITALWPLVALTAYAFFNLSRLAGVLMLPYLAWVSFAAVLNFAIWHLN